MCCLGIALGSPPCGLSLLLDPVRCVRPQSRPDPDVQSLVETALHIVHDLREPDGAGARRRLTRQELEAEVPKPIQARERSDQAGGEGSGAALMMEKGGVAMLIDSGRGLAGCADCSRLGGWALLAASVRSPTPHAFMPHCWLLARFFSQTGPSAEFGGGLPRPPRGAEGAGDAHAAQLPRPARLLRAGEEPRLGDGRRPVRRAGHCASVAARRLAQLRRAAAVAGDLSGASVLPPEGQQRRSFAASSSQRSHSRE